MLKRMLLMLAIVVVVLVSLGYFKTRQIQAAIKEHSFAPPPEAVTTVLAKEATWPTTMTVVGSMEAVHGVTVSADLPGTVSVIHFDSGRMVQKGEILAELDTRQERAQLAAMEAQRDLAKVNHARYLQLMNEGVISKMDYDKAMADDRQTEANVNEIRATIDRKTIRAPFSGVLGIRQANLGQYLAAGQAIVPLQSLNPIYVNFSVPQQVLGQVRVGQAIQFKTDSLPGRTFRGKINAINSVIDPATRNVEVQATVGNADGKLHPGMFTQVEVGVGGNASVIPLPASAINYAPFGDSVYIVEQMKGPDGKSYQGVRQQFVKVRGSRGDQVGVVEGVKPGEQIVTSGGFKLRNGAAIAVNNTVQPSDSPAPRPEDN
ncbi:MAG: efflux RND transporter periplasmic adaptor subunit [Terriglobia bacterium]|jgi:membrane fusion protein (multidrug efflux system)|nr:efflux RND transporter periplasmic adaptor subunit [Terriglobia bacterium]